MQTGLEVKTLIIWAHKNQISTFYEENNKKHTVFNTSQWRETLFKGIFEWISVLNQGVALRANTVGQKLEWQLLATAHDKQVPPCSAQQHLTHSFRWCFISNANLKCFRCQQLHLNWLVWTITTHASWLIARKMNKRNSSHSHVPPEPVSSSNDQMMMFGSWVHPAGVVMGSRWLVVPTPTAQSLVRLRAKASLCMPSRSVLVSV